MSNWKLVLFALSLFASHPAEACLSLAACQAALVDPVPSIANFPPCCCEKYSLFAAPYASRNACLAANYSATYGGGAPAAPATCAAAGLQDAGALCPNNTACTSIVRNGIQCACPAGKEWKGDMCVVNAPSARGTCTTPASAAPGQWISHRCKVFGGECDESPFPIPVPPPGTTFTDLANPMAACCAIGWAENVGSGMKLDCVEAIPGGPAGMSAGPPDTRLNTFLRFYLYVPTGNANLQTAGMAARSNQIFLPDSKGVPLNGFYNQKGNRCIYQNAAGAQLFPDAATQMTMIETALTTDVIPTNANTATATDPRVDPFCCEVVTFALERRCPATDMIGGETIAASFISGGITYRRCTAAKEMKVHFGVIDLCDPTVVKRGRFRIATSFPEVDPTRMSAFPIDPVDIQNLIGEFYPPILPLTPPECPQRTYGSNTSTIYKLPWSDSCRLRANEPPFPYP